MSLDEIPEKNNSQKNPVSDTKHDLEYDIDTAQDLNLILNKLTHTEISTEWSGPIPPPEVLKQYNQIYPELAETIIHQWMGETNHRHEIENKLVNDGISRAKTGQFLGFFIAIFAFIVAGYCATVGSPYVGSVIAGGTTLGIVSIFVIGRKNSTPKNKNIEDDDDFIDNEME